MTPVLAAMKKLCELIASKGNDVTLNVYVTSVDVELLSNVNGLIVYGTSLVVGIF